MYGDAFMNVIKEWWYFHDQNDEAFMMLLFVKICCCSWPWCKGMSCIHHADDDADDDDDDDNRDHDYDDDAQICRPLQEWVWDNHHLMTMMIIMMTLKYVDLQ